jgi:hypothetical protein
MSCCFEVYKSNGNITQIEQQYSESGHIIVKQVNAKHTEIFNPVLYMRSGQAIKSKVHLETIQMQPQNFFR